MKILIDEYLLLLSLIISFISERNDWPRPQCLPQVGKGWVGLQEVLGSHPRKIRLFWTRWLNFSTL